MSGWQVWLRTLVGLVIIIGFFQMLLPEGGLRKLAKMVMGLVIMLAVLQPILTLLNSNWSIETYLTPQLAGVPVTTDWSSRADEIFTAGVKPVYSQVTKSTEYQLEALLLTNPAIADAAVELSLTQNGVASAYAHLIPHSKLSTEEELLQLSNQAKLTISRYLQIPLADVSVTFE